MFRSSILVLLFVALIPRFAIAQTSSVGAGEGLRNQSNGGGSGCSTGTSTALQKGNGSGGCSNAASGTDFAPATSGTSLLKGSGSGTFANAVAGTDYAPATSGFSLLKGNNAGGFAAAVAGTDFLVPPSGTSLLKANSGGALANAVSGTDYAPATSGTAIQKGNGSGGFSAAAAGSDYALPTTGAANTPLFADGAGGFISGTRSGNTTKVPTVSGTVTSGHYAGYDASGNLIDNGSGTGTVPGGSGPGAIQYYGAAGGFAGSAPITGLIRGNGTSAPSAAVSGTDFAPPTASNAIQKGNGSGGFASAVAGADYAPSTFGSAILKGNGTGGFSLAISGTDFLMPPTGTAILKANSGGALANAISGTDYAPATAGLSLLKGNGSGGFASAIAGTDYQVPINGATALTTLSETTGSVTNKLTPSATTGFLNDINGNVSLAAADAANDGNDIQEIGTDAQNNVHIGGGAAQSISLDNSSAVNQGQFSSGAYLYPTSPNTSFTGGTDNCAQSLHVYTLAANATITVNCGSSPAQHLTYYIYQPATGSTFTYKFAVTGGSNLFPTTAPVSSCVGVNGCLDKVTIDWVGPPSTDYIENLANTGMGGGGGTGAICPTGQICYYVSSSIGSDSNDGLGPDATGSHHPFATIDKANNVLHLLNPGDRILFRASDTWDGANALNHPFYLRGSANESLSSATYAAITTSTRIVIGRYGTGADPKFDMKNNWGYCFHDLDDSTGLTAVGGAAFPLKDVTVEHFECTRAIAQGVTLKPNGAISPNMVVRYMNIHHTGYGCSNLTSGNCLPVTDGSNSIAPVWLSGHTYGQNTPTVTNVVMGEGSGSTHQWFKQTATNCTSGGSTPNWPNCDTPGTCTPGVTSINEGSPVCTWVYVARGYTYANQLEWDETTDPPGQSNTDFDNNTVSNGGGHNLIQIEGDTGNIVLQGNTSGPGGVHGTLDVKRVGNHEASPTRMALIAGNTVSCGFSLGTCGTGYVPSFFTEGFGCVDAGCPNGNNTEFIRWQLNTVFDAPVGFQVAPSAGNSICPGNGSPKPCPVFAQIWNNTAYVTGKPAGSFGVQAGNATTQYGGSTIDVRNNIFDGFATVLNIPSGATNYASITESFNNLGGRQGYTTYIVNGHSPPASDLNCTGAGNATCDPLYNCETGGTCGNAITNATLPNFGLQTGSPAANAASSDILITGHSNMGAY